MGNYHMDVTYEYAVNDFKSKPAAVMAANSGCDFDEEKNIIYVDYLTESYQVTYPTGEVSIVNKEGEVDLKLKVLLLHYLFGASGMPLTGNKISFKEVPGGENYIGPFNNRSLFPFIRMFGENADALKRVAEKLGGTPEKMGDLSFTIPVLPKIPVTFVLWLGDDEFPANGTVLFDSSATSYLPTEDFAVIAQFTVFKMKALLG